MSRSRKILLFIAGIILLSVLIVVTFLLVRKITAPTAKPMPISTPRPLESFARPAAQKASYNSIYLKRNVVINNVPEFVAIPASFIINDNQVNGVVVKIIDQHHFILESRGTIIPTVMTTKTSYLEYVHQPGTPLNLAKNFIAKSLSGDQSKLIGQQDFLTVFYKKISASSSATLSNWQQDQEHNFQAKQVLLYEKI